MRWANLLPFDFAPDLAPGPRLVGRRVQEVLRFRACHPDRPLAESIGREEMAMLHRLHPPGSPGRTWLDRPAADDPAEFAARLIGLYARVGPEDGHRYSVLADAVRAEVARQSGELPPAPTDVVGPAGPPPAGITVAETADGLTVSWRWFQPAALLLAPFVAAFLIGAGLLVWKGLEPPVFWPFLLGLLPFAGLALWLAYFLAAVVANRTVVRVELPAGTLTVRHRPLPWSGERTLPAGQVVRLAVRRLDRSSGHGGRPLVSYQVWAVGQDGGETLVVSGLHDLDQGLYLARAVNSRLGVSA